MNYLAELKIKEDVLLATGSTVSQCEFESLIIPLNTMNMLQLQRLKEIVSLVESHKWRESLMSGVKNDTE